MPVYAADVLPDTTGRNLGSPPQRWNGFFQNLDIQGSLNYQPVQGANLGPSGVAYVATSPILAAVNTTGRQDLGSYTIPAGLLNKSGKVLRGTAGGTYTTQVGQTAGMILWVSFGGLPIFSIGYGALLDSQTGNKWRAQWEFIVTATGTSGQIIPHGMMTYQIRQGNNTAYTEISVDSPASPIDLTVAQNVLSQCQWTTNTSPANICTQDMFIVEILN